MKVCFSTLGCPEWSFKDILAVAGDFGYDGIEIRGVASELYAPDVSAFSPANIEATKKLLADKKLEIPVLASSCLLASGDRCLDEGKDYIDLASHLGTKYVRVLGDKNPKAGDGVDDRTVADAALKLSGYAEAKGVTLLIETNGVYADSARLAALLRDIGRSNVAALWDIHHPYRFMNEPYETTYANLREFIRHIHFKDSAVENGEVVYKMPGHGTIPADALVSTLKSGAYDGFISLEWVRRWNPQLESADIVFAIYANYIKTLWNC